MKIPRVFWILSATAAFLFGGFAALAATGLKIYLSYMEGESKTIREEWRQAPAKVIHSEVVSGRSDNATTYRPEIRYEFTVEGKTYKANRYGLLSWSSSNWSEHQRVVDEHPVGSEITIYYNPADPYDAVIDPEFSSEGCVGFIFYYLLAMAIVFLSAGFVGVFILRRTRPRPESAS